MKMKNYLKIVTMVLITGLNNNTYASSGNYEDVEKDLRAVVSELKNKTPPGKKKELLQDIEDTIIDNNKSNDIQAAKDLIDELDSESGVSILSQVTINTLEGSNI